MKDETPIPKVAAVASGPAPSTLRVTWRGGRTDLVDLSGMIARVPGLAPLGDPDLFARARPVARGVGVGWPGDIDIAGVTLEFLAAEQRAFAADDFAAWQEQHGLSNRNAADLLGVTLSTIKNYRSGATIPASIKIACRALGRDPLALRAHFRPRVTGRPRTAKAAAAEVRR
jgi:hypothetical protein